jgi:predicted ATPase/DNA-binding CsgD family transcriptional regulator
VVAALRRETFFGRDDEIRLLSGRLSDPAFRLTSLVGIGGVGKTTLALRVAHDVAGQFADGVAIIDLTTVDDPSLVPLHVQRSLGFEGIEPQTAPEVIVERLRERNQLIVLDNFEHLLEARGLLAEIHRQCPRVWQMVTSRLKLGVPNEVAVTIRPFPVAEHDRGRPPMDLTDDPAMELLVHELRLTDPAFALTAANAHTLQSLCRKLDGLPLAIQLLARRLPRLLSLGDIDDHLDLRMVRSAKGDEGNARHDSLAAILDWSYRRLSSQQRTVLSALAAFGGGATLDGLTAVVNDQGPEAPPEESGDLESHEALDAIEELTSSGLVRVEQSAAGTRFTMLRVIRDYCRGPAAQPVAEANARWDAAHARFFLELATAARAGLSGTEPKPWSERIDREQANLRQALGWFYDQSETPERGVEIATGIWLYWRQHGQLTEAIRWLERGIARCEQTPSVPLARAYLYLGHSIQASAERRSIAYERAFRLFQALDDLTGQTGALDSLALVAIDQGELTKALDALKLAYSLAKRSGDRTAQGFVLGHLGYLMNRKGDYAAANDYLTEALRIWKKQRSSDNVGFTLLDLGRLERRRGRFKDAERYLTQSEAVFRQAGSIVGRGYALHELGLAHLALERRDRAMGAFKQALQVMAEAKLWDDPVMSSVEGIGCLVVDSQPQAALRLLSAVAAWRQTNRMAPAAADRTVVDKAWATLRQAMDGETIAGEQLAAELMDVDAILAFATGVKLATDNAAGITPAEIEVLRLTADGLKDEEIAEQLTLSVHTVHKHQANIRGKLGVNKRMLAVNEARRLDII